MIIADLHIHSKYSRATSPKCDPESLDFWARRKGIGLLGTGDFTHPAWRKELKEKLVPAEHGFYALKQELQIADAADTGSKTPRFVISGEISSIYKKNGKVRKVHNVILLPGLEEAETLSHKLEAIGNIHSDGRPILGLDSRDLLEIALEVCPDMIFIPAHIWTPHFSMFGAFSGFDTIEECFEDLTPYIYALETGLSSDPDMNWRLSALDGYTLVSNSDAHSPAKLGREANLLDTELSYPALSHALEMGKNGGFAGTIEFFPEEGKYHLDGHRNCNLCLSPAETAECGGKCPVCGKKITIGVLHRVEQLADREKSIRPENAAPFESLVPLPEVIAASTGGAATGAKTEARYEQLLSVLGPEFSILREVPLEDIGHVAGPCIEEGIRRLRSGRVEWEPGYDGKYGKLKLLEKDEIETLGGQISLFVPEKREPKKNKTKQGSIKKLSEAPGKHDVELAAESVLDAEGILTDLNAEQREAVTATASVMAVIAGPGTGKTKTLVSKIAYLIGECGVSPSEITAVTFTNKAAEEMRTRLEKQLGGKRAVRAMTIGTFHSICLQLLSGKDGDTMLIDEYGAREIAERVLRQFELSCTPKQFLQEVSAWKNGRNSDEGKASREALEAYDRQLQEMNLLDFDDLLLYTLAEWEAGRIKKIRMRGFAYLLVDEFQDINDVQYRLVRAWSENGKELFVIGDPDQSIYGFRGSDAHCFERLAEDTGQASVIRLVKNYRSTPEIINCALPVILKNEGDERRLEAQRADNGTVSLLTAESELSEAIFVAKEINRLVGGIDMLDSQRFASARSHAGQFDFSDVAVLYRTHRQARILEKCLRKEGIPYIVAGRDDLFADEIARGTVSFFRFLLCPTEAHSLRTCLRTLWNCPEDIIQGFAAAWEKTAVRTLTEECLEEMVKPFENIGYLQKWIRLARHFVPRIHKEKPRKLLELWAEENGLQEHEPLRRLMNMAVFHSGLDSFLQNLLLGQEYDWMRCSGKEYVSGAVRLMTFHGAKGLEFPVVFLCGLKKGVIPLETVKQPADMEEERRLFYVGMTRARDELILLTSPEPSVFLEDIPAEFLHTGMVRERKPQPEGKQLSLF